MQTLPATGPNAEQITYWNETAGPRWVAQQHLLNAQIEPLGLRAMEAAAIIPGEHVIDVGCGCGQTSLELARRVGAAGTVTGVDISTPMLAQARHTAEVAGAVNVRFQNADAQTHAFAPQRSDLVFSRFGVMFFSDPPAAFANLRAATRAGGRLAFVCWQSLRDNPWMFIPVMAAATHIPMPIPTNPHAPGPFAFAEREYVSGILSRAGWEAVGLDACRTTLTLAAGSDLDQTVAFLMQMGPVGSAARSATAEQIAAASDAVRDALRPYLSPDGVRMDAAVWLVSASNRD